MFFPKRYKITEALFKEIWESLTHIADVDKDGKITKKEWDADIAFVAENEDNVMAIRPGGSNDITAQPYPKNSFSTNV